MKSSSESDTKKSMTNLKWMTNLLITSMIRDRIWQLEVLLPINQNYDNILETN